MLYGMGMLMPLILQLARLCIIGFPLIVQESSGHNASPSPAKFFMFPPAEGIPSAVEQRSDAPNTLSQPNGSDLHSPPALPPLMSASVPETTEGHARSFSPSNSMELPPYNMAPPPVTVEEGVPSLAPSTPAVLPPFDTAPSPMLVQVHTPSKSPTALPKKEPIMNSSCITLKEFASEFTSYPPISINNTNTEFSRKFTTPFAPPLRNPPQNSPPTQSSRRSAFPPISNQRNSSSNRAPVLEPTAPAPVAPPLRNPPQNSPAIHFSKPHALPPSANQGNSSNKTEPVMEPIAPVPVATPSGNLPRNQTAIHPRGPALAPSVPIPEPTAPVPVATPSGNSPRNQTAIHPRGPALAPSVPIPEPTAPVASPPRKLERTTPPVHSIMPPSILPVVSPPEESPHISPTIHPNVPEGTPSQLPDPDISPVSTPPSSINWKNDGIPVASPRNEIHKPMPPLSHTPENGVYCESANIKLIVNLIITNNAIELLKLLFAGSSSAKSPLAPKAVRHPGNSPVSSLAPSNKGYNPPALSPSISFHKHQHKRNGRTSPAPASSYLISPPPLKQQGPVISPAFLPGRRRRHYAPAPLHSVSPSHSAVPSSVGTVSPVPSPSPMTASRQTKMPLSPPKVSPSVSPLRSPKVPPPPPVMSFPPPPPNEDCSTTICTEPYTNTPPGSPCGCVLPMQVGLRLSVALYTFFPLVSELATEIAAGVFMKQSQVRIIGANAASEQPEKTVVLIDLVPLGEKFDNTTAFLTYQRFWHKQVAIKTSFFGDYEVLYVRYLGLPPSPPLPPSDIDIMDAGPYSGNDNNARAIKPLGVDVHGKRHKNVLSGGVIAIIVLSALVAMVLCSAIAWVLLFRRTNHASQQAATTQPPQTSLAKPSGSAGSMVGSGLSSTSLSFGSSIVAYTGSAKTFSTSDIEKATNNFDASRILGEGGFGRVYSGVLEDGTKVAVKVLKRDDQQGGREFLAEVEMLSRLHHRNLVKLIGICTEERNRCLVYELIPNGSVESHLHGVDKDSAPLDWDARIKIALGAARGLAYLHEDSSPRVIHRDFKSSNILLEHDFTPKVSDFGLARTAMDEEGRHISTRVMGTFGVAKVAAIASMCVQPEVSHRPFMGEVVQALKLVCNECDEAKEVGSRCSSQDDLSIDLDARVSTGSGQLADPLQSHYLIPNYDTGLDTERGLSVSDLFSSSARFGRQSSGSFRRHCSSGPLRTARGSRFWQKVQRLSRGSISEHGVMMRFWPGSH
ncbi:Serine-threonine/tyrosine-protein kinase [Theobroma cacao]|nr:Serine-threonine/tyrosine-protein kinase [Theobroma cacao]